MTDAVHEAANVAGQTITALKTEPVLLLIVILNIVMLLSAGLVGWAAVDKLAAFSTAEEGFRHEERVAIMTLCIPQAKAVGSN